MKTRSKDDESAAMGEAEARRPRFSLSWSFIKTEPPGSYSVREGFPRTPAGHDGLAWALGTVGCTFLDQS